MNEEEAKKKISDIIFDALISEKIDAETEKKMKKEIIDVLDQMRRGENVTNNLLITTGENITDAAYDKIRDKKYIDYDVLMKALSLLDKKLKPCPNCNHILTLMYDDAGTKIVDAHCDSCGFKGGIP